MNNYECGNTIDKLYTDTDIDPVYEDKLIKVANTCFFPLFRQNAKNEDYINTLIAAGYKLINEDHGSPNIAYNCDKYEFIRGDHE